MRGRLPAPAALAGSLAFTAPALLAVTVLSAAPAGAQTGDAAAVATARDHYVAGEYDRALATLRPLVRGRGAGEAPAAVRRDALVLHARVLEERGRYREALDLLDDGAGTSALRTGTARIRGDLLLETGRWDEAGAAYRAAMDGGAPDALLARLRLAELDFLRGRRDEAMAAFDGFIDLYNSGAARTGEDLLAVARAVTWLGRRNPALFQDALRAWDEAAELLPGDPRPAVAVGDLFLSRYTSTDAYGEYRRVLDRNPGQPDALLGRARAQRFDGSPEAMATAEAVLETNPNSVGAHALLARLHLRAEAWDRARESAERALEINPASLEALSTLAAVAYLEGDTAEFDAVLARADALNPVQSVVHGTVAELAADTRKYDDAVELAREAVRRDPRAWDALGTLATNQLRTGRLNEGRANMERAFAGDPYNPWFKNQLDLLDTFDQYRIVETEHFRIALHESEADLLEPYVVPLAERAYAELAARYGAEPPTPIRLELFPRSADFSVRTLGLVGLGALGVSFGSTLVMDSPSAKEAGEFNWASTLWHELAHAFHLGISDHEVPRWFSEGLAVREQRVADGRWGFPVPPGYLQAWQAERMPPLSRMNEGFVRPRFPEQIVYSYIQASLAFDWIEQRWGFEAVRAFLDGYREGRSTARLSRDVLGLDEEGLDEAFREYMALRFEGELRALAPVGGAGPPGAPVGEGAGDETGEGAGDPHGGVIPGMGPADVETLRNLVRSRPGSFPARLALGQALMAEDRFDEAEPHLREALRLFPAYPGLDGPLRHLAEIHRARGETRQAAAALFRLGTLNESAWPVYREEAELRRELGDAEGERVALAKAVEVYPYVADLHQRLAELHADAGDTAGAVVERRALLSLDPVDRAAAHYELARALVADGRRGEARSQVLRALEIAPTWEPALELLLELRGGGS